MVLKVAKYYYFYVECLVMALLHFRKDRTRGTFGKVAVQVILRHLTDKDAQVYSELHHLLSN